MGKTREVDVCIEGTQAGHPFVISIECVSYGRPATIEWVERMAAKHQDLATDKLILRSNAPFTRDALEEAKSRGIETATFRAVAEDDDNTRLFSSLDTLMAKNFTLSPSKVVIKVPAYSGLAEERVAVQPDNTLFGRDGEELGSVMDLVMGILQSDHLRGYVLEHGDEAHKGFIVEMEIPTGPDGSPEICMEKIDSLLKRPTQLIRIGGECEIKASRIAMQLGVLGRVRVAWAETTAYGRTLFLVASDNEAGERKLSFMPVPAGEGPLVAKGDSERGSLIERMKKSADQQPVKKVGRRRARG
jgi:hypothetical protein